MSESSNYSNKVNSIVGQECLGKVKNLNTLLFTTNNLQTLCKKSLALKTKAKKHSVAHLVAL